MDTTALLFLALGLWQWKDVLRIIARSRRTSEPDHLSTAALGARAWQEFGRWDRVLTMAREGEIKEGRFPKAPWLSTCYLRALVETVEDIEALRLLGKPEQGKPGFYSLLRGRALHAAGDRAGTRAAFERYLDAGPGDFETRSEMFPLFGNDD